MKGRWPILLALLGSAAAGGCRRDPALVLIVEVRTEDAIADTLADAVHATRALAEARKAAPSSVASVDATAFAVEGLAEPAAARGWLAAGLGPEWEVSAEPARVIVRLASRAARDVRERAMAETIRVLERRADPPGLLSRATVTSAGGERIKVELRGVRDVEAVKRVLTRGAKLELKLVQDTAPTREGLPGGASPPPSLEVIEGPGDAPGEKTFYLVQRAPIITGRDFKNVRAGVDVMNAPDIEFRMTPAGGEKLARATARNVGRRLAIVLDGVVQSAPVVSGEIRENGEITGRFTREEAEELARVLRAGALPAGLRIVEERTGR